MITLDVAINTGITYRVARTLGFVFGPPLMPLLVVALAAASSETQLDPLNIVMFLGFMAFFPALFVYIAYRKGYVSDLGMSDRKQRHLTAIAALLMGILGVGMLILRHAEASLIALAAGICVQLVVLELLTLQDKVSYHSAGTSGLAVAALFLVGISTGVTLLAVALATGWSRWYLGKHSMRQVILGLASSTALVFWFGVVSARLGLLP